MKKLFPEMLDRPETGSIVSGVVYAVLCFWSMPFIILLFLADSLQNPSFVATAELVYHAVNGIAAVCIFRGFLKDSFLNVQADKASFFATVGVCASLMLGYSLILSLVCRFSSAPLVQLAAGSTLPLAEMEALMLSSNLVYHSPALGMLCIVFLSPIAISCLHYSVAFCPVATSKPVLAYLVLAVVLFLPRLANGMTYWNLQEEIILFFVQLPLHLIACWGFQKTDSVWTPIASLFFANLFSCAMLLVNSGVLR